ncbi:MAG: hypothetical protein QXR85_01155 [Candidatus Micrarchaeaceae archaeon]
MRNNYEIEQIDALCRLSVGEARNVRLAIAYSTTQRTNHVLLLCITHAESM